MKRLASLLVCATAVSLWQSQAQSKELTVGNYLPPSHYSTVHGLVPLAEAVKKETNGSLTFKLFAGGQLYNAQRSLSGIGNRLSDGGLVVPLFARSDLRHAILATDLVFSTSNPLVAAAASTEMILLRCPECQNDYKKTGSLFLAGYSTTNYTLMCKPDVKSIADVKGKKIRSVGSQGQLAKEMGGVPVSMPMTEAVEAMQRNAIDCIIGPFSWLTAYPGTDEVVKHVVDYPFGLSSGIALFVMNRQSWSALEPAHKKAIIKSLPGAIAEVMVVGTFGDLKRAEEAAKKRGITIVKGGKEFADLVARFRKKEDSAVIARAGKLGVKNAQSIADRYFETTAKWEKIMQKIGDDKAAFAKALQDEIYSKLDVNKL
ncbi:MAG: C4-dicarboxylate TRAP transporter substrate-binding protein [Thermomicrobiales bacterium]